MNNSKWLTEVDDIYKSLLADEAKNNNILEDLQKTLSQLKAKSNFRLALLNQLMNKGKN